MKTPTIIEKVINEIDWDKIESYHITLNLVWELRADNGNIGIPTVKDLQDEMINLLTYMDDNELDYLSYGNWVIFWEEGANAGEPEIQAMFKLIDFIITDKNENSYHIPFEHLTHMHMTTYDWYSRNDSELIEKNLAAELLNSINDDIKLAIEEEDYERASILRDKLNEYNKKNNNKNEQ